MRAIRLIAVLGLAVVAACVIYGHHARKVNAFTCSPSTCAPPPPPPPTVGEFGGPLAGLTSTQTSLFNGGYGEFAIKWDPIRGLGPVSTRTGCFDCHGAGANVLTGTAGDTSNATGTRYGKWNPDGTFNYLDGSGTFPENEGGPVNHGVSNGGFNTLPGCNPNTVAKSPTGLIETGNTVTLTTLTAHGYKTGQQLQIGGAVGNSGYKGIYTIDSVPTTTTLTFTSTTTGLPASGGGSTKNLPTEVVPADATVVSNVRSPQLFGLGLIDNISDADILANVGVSKPYGITGEANMVPDEFGAIRPGKFGQKSTIVTLYEFNFNAEFNELGMTNGVFPNKHLPQGLPYPSACVTDPNSPNDGNYTVAIKNTQFVALLAPIPPQPPTQETEAGFTVFQNTGCSVCHIVSFTTQPDYKLRNTDGGYTDTIDPLSNVTFSPYSDFLIHDMGSGDSGGIPYQPSQTGQADLTHWRTAPLWGLSNILLKAGGLMHDNASTSIDAAIRRHGGEAATVESMYAALDSTDQSNLLAFLNSL